MLPNTKTLVLVLALSLAAWGQRLTVTAPASGSPGQTVSVVLGVEVGSSNVVAAQWSMPASLFLVPTQPTFASKSLICSTATCLIFGVVPAPVNGVIVSGSIFNNTPMVGGPLQNYTYTIPATAAAGSVVSIAPTGAMGVAADGSLISLSVTGASITVLSQLDLTGDGKIDKADAQVAFTAWQGNPTSSALVLLIKVIAAIQP